MKQLFLAAFTLILLASCYSKKLTYVSTPENFQVREISDDSAKIYRKNYEDDPKFKADFRQGMYIPIKIIDAIRTEQGLNGIMIYYGKTPEFKSPVFLVSGTKDILNYKRSKDYSGPLGITTYMVYYPCPTQCGK
ncbi:hypothetical protein [Flavihumibacter profundi]|jgi:hypothetical protein|uniref:hypothetical protein n=1 Tax=Flavihumibacter profundi TaxID=2716883 RepID=UPI001CC52C4F|nr:hypothetical protein [Flavihumibacter profundi]MBZ5857036.1 hypothetical protein [Flavihumibacter profundi]